MLGILLLAAPLRAAELVDPTRPPASHSGAAEPAPAEGWQLTSILVSPERRVAVIDGRRLRVGDRLGDAEVVEIRLTGVRLRNARGVLELPLQPSRMGKRPVTEE
jgi:MSHA biogenesis protein MshK